jgi:hypothetical protein
MKLAIERLFFANLNRPKEKPPVGRLTALVGNTRRSDSCEVSLRRGGWMCAVAHVIKNLPIPNLNVPHAQPQQKMAQN